MGKSISSMNAKYLRGIQNGAQSWEEGIDAVTQNPAEAAIASKGLWEQRIQEAIANDSYVTGLQRVTLPGWKAKTKAAKQKYSGSAPTASANWGAFAQKAKPVWDQISSQVKSMPKGTLEDSVARVRASMMGMRQLKGVKG